MSVMPVVIELTETKDHEASFYYAEDLDMRQLLIHLTGGAPGFFEDDKERVLKLAAAHNWTVIFRN